LRKAADRATVMSASGRSRAGPMGCTAASRLAFFPWREEEAVTAASRGFPSAVFAATALRVILQLEITNPDEVIPDFDQFAGDVLVLGQPFPDVRAVVVADEHHPIAGPTSGDGTDRATDGTAFVTSLVVTVEIATSALVALAEQEGEDRAVRVGGPLPELGAAAKTPGADNFLFVFVYGFEVLTHRKKGERDYSLPLQDSGHSPSRIAAMSVTIAGPAFGM
jgi:hypothetical protein